MTCRRVDLEDGSWAIVCGGGRRRAWCDCGGECLFLCDGPSSEPGKSTCSRRLCAEHAHQVGPNRHLCGRCFATKDLPSGVLDVYSSRIAYGGPDRLDVTRAGGDALGLNFAPSWAILEPAIEARRKAGEAVQGSLFGAEGSTVGRQDVGYGAAWHAFREAYLAEMRASFRERREAWLELLGRPRVVLVCYCVDGARCHRHLLRSEILPRLGAVDRGEFPPTWWPLSPTGDS